MRVFQNSKTGKPKRFWTMGDVCNKYNVHRRTVCRWRLRGLPAVDWKKFVLFPLPESRLWIEANVSPVINPADFVQKHPYLK